MQLSPGKLLEHARSPEGRKQLRYLGVSLVFVPIGQILIQIVARIVGSFTAASIISAMLLTPLNFFANKLYVWKVTSKDRLGTQITVFWVGAVLAVTMATGFTYLVEQATQSASELVRSTAVFFAQLAGFGIVWVARYLILDRWLFKLTHDGEEPTEDEIEDLHHDFPI